MRGAFFHPTTGYSLPEAVGLAEDLATHRHLSGPELHARTRRRSFRHWRRGGYYRLLNRMLFRAADPERRYRIFERFYRVRGPDTDGIEGTGLGLASVYGIIKNHGGYINVYSEIGQGTAFTIYLPASAKAVQPEVKTVTPTVVTGNGTILLIDDEKMIIDVGQELLQELGYDVLTATSGKEAVEIYRQKSTRIDLVIMDLIMPGMSGGETYDRLKEINSHIKVLLSSGYSINGKAAKIIERGCDGVIQKPFNINQLSEKIRAIISKK
mgnify:CR=1 FL=1